jgi:hypothetical protein
MRPWYGRPRPTRVWRDAADGPAVRAAHPIGYSADDGDAWPGRLQGASGRVRVRKARGSDGVRARMPRRSALGRGAAALWPDNVSMCPGLNMKSSKFLNRSAQSGE